MCNESETTGALLAGRLFGGHDLVGKPFLPFEIALKALTLVIRAGGPRQPPARKRVKAQTSVSVTATSQAPVASTADQQAALPAGPANQAPGTQVEDFAKTFLANAPASLRSLQGTAASLRTATDHKAQQEPLRKLHGEIHALALQATPAGLHSIAALACALEILLAKLIEKPALRTLPVLESAGTALDLLEEFCSGSQALPVPDASPRILVVDDDPIACRAMCAALQLKFGKPETANSGEAALKLASEKVYDLIFLDVRMPGMDGFTACSKIRVTSTNGGTPIVFVTTLTDTEAQDQCTLSGGDAYIAKPVFPAQIALAATTFSLRGKLNQFKASAVAAVP